MKRKEGFVLWKVKDSYGLMLLIFMSLFILNGFFRLFPHWQFCYMLMVIFLILSVVFDSTIDFQKSDDWRIKSVFSFWKIKIRGWSLGFFIYFLLTIPILVLVPNSVWKPFLPGLIVVVLNLILMWILKSKKISSKRFRRR